MMTFMVLFWLALIVLCVSVMRSLFNPYHEQHPIKRKRSPIPYDEQREFSREEYHALFNNKYNQQENDHVY